MGLFDYVAMVEETPVDTHAYRVSRRDSGGTGRLVACALTDGCRTGCRMVYSFFRSRLSARSLGTYMILDHVRAAQAQAACRMSIWAIGCAAADKMDYKIRFSPLEALTQNGWEALAI